MAAGSIPVRQAFEVLPDQGPVVYQNIDTNADMFGAAQGRALTALGGTIQQLGGVFDAKAEEVNKNRVMEAYSGAKDKLRDYLYNPQNGLYTRKGGQAMGAHPAFVQFSEDLMGETQKLLPDKKSQETFQRMWLQERDSMNDGVMRFEGAQVEEYGKVAATSMVKSAADMAAMGYNDPKIVAKSIDDIRRAIRVQNQGAPLEAIRQLESAAISSTYQQMILRAAVDDPVNANKMFKQYQGGMEAKDITEVSKALAPALKKTQVNTAFSAITQSGAVAGQVYKIDQGHRSEAATKLVGAVIGAESTGDAGAVSPKGASGLMQVMPGTARDISKALGDGMFNDTDTDNEIIETLKLPAVGEFYGTYYLNQQLKSFDGDLEAALIAYNAGPGNAQKWVKAGRDDSVLPKAEETRPYVNKIMGAFMEGGGNNDYGVVPTRMEVDAGGLPAPGLEMNRKNWDLGFYAPQDMLPPTGGGQFVDARSAVMMDRLGAKVWEKFGKRLGINEKPDPNGATEGRRRGTADPKDNPHVDKSQHLFGRAFDVQIQGLSSAEKTEVLREARKMGFTGIGFYEGGSGHLHLDTGNARHWGRIPDWAVGVMSEAAPVRAPVPGGVVKAPVVEASTSSPPVAMKQIAINDPRLKDDVDAKTVTKEIPVVDTQSADLDSWLAQADMLDDPEIRDATKSKLVTEWNRREGLAKKEKKNNEDLAWKYVEEGGLDSLPPALRAKMDHTFVVNAMTYEEKMSKGDKIKNNDAKWYDFNRMTDDEIIDMNLTELRPHLDDEHYDKAINRQAELLRKRENPKAANAPKIDGLRTRTQVMDDTVKSLGIKDKELIGKMDIQLDKDILAFSQGHNRDPNPVEIQQMVDRMLLRDKNTYFALEGNEAVSIFGDREAIAEFVAVERPDDIPDADFSQVVETFRNHNKRSPSPAEVVDVYNNAMKAYMGGDVEIPSDIEAEFRAGIEKAKNRKIDALELNEYYKKYLLKYLGM